MIARGSLGVTFKAVDASRIPDALVEGTALLVDLRQRGFLDEVAKRLQIRRQGGFCGFDVWVVLFLYMSVGPTMGVRRFWDVLRPHMTALAALAGRRRLPSPASLSRALDAVEPELLRTHAAWLLTGFPEVDAVLRHPAMLTGDARGEGWLVVDLDPTVTTMRHRALPLGEDLPEPRRTSEDTGAPGHAGRKRGDIQHRRVTVQHAGSGIWLHAHLSKGNGEGGADLERALDTIAATCERLGHPRSRALVRMDGEYGNVPWFSACRARGLPFITRLNRPAFYDDPDVLQRLRTAEWFLVPDSRSGPRRSACDLGMLTVHADRKSKRADGTAYEPVTVRIVASRYPRSGTANRGRVIDGWQVELYAVDVEADAWPAPDAVASFFGRAGQENRFCQEDRELGLDRIVSYHVPGQELAALVGLSLWNLRLARGFNLAPPDPVRAVQELRRPQRDTRAAPTWPRDPVLCKLLASLEWTTLLAKRPGWSFDADTGELRCEEGRALTLTTVHVTPHAAGRSGVIFYRTRGGCEDCSARPTCFHSARPLASKHVEFLVPSDLATPIGARLALVRGKVERKAVISMVPITTAPGPLDVTPSMFLPARARETFDAIFARATLHAHVVLPPPATPRLTLVAAGVADRQRRRHTWEQNVARYALPDGARVELMVEGATEFRQLLGETRCPKSQVGG